MTPDLSRLRSWSDISSNLDDNFSSLSKMYNEAVGYISFYNWVEGIKNAYVGIVEVGIVAIFLFNIEVSRKGVGEWVWVIVGDIPPAYLPIDDCPTPAAALDGYVGAMLEWVEAARVGASVANLIPVNVRANPENAEELSKRLKLIDEHILCKYEDDL